MPRFAANLTMLYNEHEFLDRFAAAARDGFTGIEYLFPYAWPAKELRARLDTNGLQQILFNAPPGDWDAGERGTASLIGREAEFRDGILRALDYAGALGNTLIHVMAGRAQTGVEAARQRALYIENLSWSAQQAKAQGITLIIEPINTRDMPGYLLNYQRDAQAICAEINAAFDMPTMKVLFDLYHCQIMEGDLAETLKRDLAGIGHIQIAGVPGRHEPDIGEINYPYLFALMDDLGYQGWVGCEYRPSGASSAGLGWRAPWLGNLA